MEAKDIQLLSNLYSINSKTGKEEQISKFVQDILKKHNMEFKLLNKQIYNLIPDTPLISAHMDQVGEKKLLYTIIKDGIIYGNDNIGADDKNGVFILIKTLTDERFKNKVSFIFSTEEECGSTGMKKFKQFENELKQLKYGLVFDRRNGTDVICFENEYGTEEFDNDLTNLDDTYKSVVGSISDCDFLKHYMSCANISCGYYKPHTDREYSSVQEIEKSLQFCTKILTTLTKRYEPVPKKYHNWYDEKEWTKHQKLWSKNDYIWDKDWEWDEKDELYVDEETILACNDCNEMFTLSDLLVTSMQWCGDLKDRQTYQDIVCPECWGNDLVYFETEEKIDDRLDEAIIYYIETFLKRICDECGSDIYEPDIDICPFCNQQIEWEVTE